VLQRQQRVGIGTAHFPLDTCDQGRIDSPKAKNFALTMTSKPRPIHLTRRESQIMEILHRRQRAAIEDIRAELPDPPSPSSVRKLLEIMIERGLLRREYDGPRYVYFPAAAPEDASRSALKQLVRTFFNDSPGSAMAALLDLSGKPISDEEYRRLSAMLKRVREQGDKS
jgi:BlaI family transcriptional regulator, penicillinase repressor